jgi:glycosyltransferase involved in cell wall biosynthesis
MSERDILLSVVIPCFNYEAYVGEAIEGVLAQKTPDMEVIVVDDGSTDGSWDVIRGYDDRAICIRTENRGQLAAYMTGFERARGAFVHFLDADDVLCPGAIEVLRPHMRPQVSKIQFMLAPIDKAGRGIGQPFPKLDASADSGRLIELIARRGSYATPPTSGNVYRRDVYEEVGDLSYERSIDGAPYLLAPFLGEVVTIDQPLGLYRIHGTNASSFSTMSAERIDYCIERFQNRLQHLKALLAEKKPRRDFEVKPHYAYVGELQLMGAVARGRRPSADLLAPYLKSLIAEQSGAPRLFHAAFALLLFVLPASLAAKLMAFRVNPSSLSWVRTRVKALMAP